jgi:hypothetical protein
MAMGGLRWEEQKRGKRNQDTWALGEAKGFSASDFRGCGVDEQISTFLFLPAFVSVLSGKPAPQKPVFSFSSF